MRSLCIIPVYNQALDLSLVLEKCRKGIACDEILLVDDGSDDGSETLIEKSGFRFLKLKERKGIGHALIQGTQYAIEQGFDIVIHMAGNGKMDPAEMPRVLNPILEGKADYVWGSRFLPGGRCDNTPAIRRYGIPFLFNLIPLIFTGKRVSDATCGFRAYRVALLEDIAKGWDLPWLFKYEFEYFVLAKVLLSRRYRYQEVPISMIYPARRKNYSKITPVISWWSMLKPWIVVRLGLEPKRISSASSTPLPKRPDERPASQQRAEG
ncbi:MAG: glycosyltransferase family 2 protein [Deltaproteobacteria bacterium]|nr:glycosyltransferase family 2 protein [Deltaproteobacteria bacterium]MBI3294182.1 glycosyltransferase family 2 protein [Deltaproteobacteria bacterium]